MNTIESYYQKYPLQTMRLSNEKIFSYQYYKHPHQNIVLPLKIL